MKNFYLLIYLACFGVISSYAQPVFNSVNYPAIGTVFTEFTVNSAVFAPGNAGANQIWDFSNLVPGSTTTTITYTVPSATPNGGLYAGSASATQNTSSFGTIYNYYTLDANKSAYMGGVYSGIIDVYTYHTPPQEYWHFPLTYNSAYTSTFSSYVSAIGPGGFSEHYSGGTFDVMADGYGTLITPAGTLPNCLRVKFTNIYMDTTYINSDTSTRDVRDIVSIKYNWISGNLNPWLTLRVDTVRTDNSVTVYENYSSSTIGVDEVLNRNSLKAYPNPAPNNSAISFDAGQLNPGEALFNVVDINGRILKNITLKIPYSDSKLITVDLSDYAPGIYHIKLQQGNIMMHDRIVVQ